MLLANRFCVRLCRPPNLSYKYYAPQTIERFASALPRARPNKDEIVRDETDTVGAATIELRKIMVPSIETTMKPRINDTEDSKIEVTSVAANVENQRWKKMTPNNLIGVYLQLSKDRLTMMITASTACGFLISGVPISWPAFGACLAGTALLSASANTCNHLLEAPYDAQMKRTQSRALVIHRISPLHAFAFANATAAVGLGFLCLGCNSLTSGLGLLNLVIYACLYTPMKRYHIGCTWVGAINGVIPPLMGYTAATGRLDMAALTLGAILFSWQFPHFNALSWNLRGDYSRAGYQVMCVTNEELCRKTTLRHAFALMGLCSVVAPLTNLGTPSFALASLPLNLAMVYYSYKFYRQPDSQSAKALFRCSTFVYLPLIMVLFRKSATKMHSNSNTSVSSGSSRGRSGRHRPKRAVIPIKKAQESEVSDSNEEIKQRELDSAKGEGQLGDNKEELMESTEGENATDTSHQNLQLTSNPSLEEGKDTVSENASDQIMSDLAEDGAIVAAASDTAPAHNVIPDESVGLSQLKDELEVAENRAVDTNEVAEQENPKAEIEPEVELKDDLSNMPEGEQKMSVSTKDSSEEDKLNDSKPVEKVSNDGESVKQADFKNSECKKTAETDSAISDSGDDMSPEPESSSEVLKKSLNEVDQPRSSGDSENVAAPKSVVRSHIIDEEDEDIPRCDLCGDPTHQSRNCTIFTKRKMEPEPNRRAPTCYYCKEVGHVKYHCPKNQNQGRGGGRNTNFNDIPTQQSSGWGAPPMPRQYSATNQSENRANFVHVPMPVLASSIKPEIKLRSQLTARNTSSKENISQIPSTSKPAPSDFGRNYVASTMQFSSNISKEVLATQPPKKKINYIRSDSEDESDEDGKITLELPSISDTNKQQVKVEKSSSIPEVQTEKEVPDTPKMMERLTLEDKIKTEAQSNLLAGGPNDNDAKPVPSQTQNDKKTTVKEDQPCGSAKANTWNSVMMEDDTITDFDSIALEKELEHLKEMRCVDFDSDESSEYEGTISDTEDYCGAIVAEEFDGSEPTPMPDVTNPEVGKDVQNS